MGTMADHMIATYREKAEKWTQQACTLDLSRKDAGWIFRIEVALSILAQYLRKHLCSAGDCPVCLSMCYC